MRSQYYKVLKFSLIIYKFYQIQFITLYTVAAIENVDKIIKISLLIIKIEYNRNTYKIKTSDRNYPLDINI